MTWTSRLVRGPNANEELSREARAEWLAISPAEQLALIAAGRLALRCSKGGNDIGRVRDRGGAVFRFVCEAPVTRVGDDR